MDGGRGKKWLHTTGFFEDAPTYPKVALDTILALGILTPVDNGMIAT